MTDLSSKKIAIITSQQGVEKPELTEPHATLTAAGATVVHLAPEAKDVDTMVGDVTPDESFPADRAIAGADVDEFDLLLIPGGTVNADTLRLDAEAISLIKDFVGAKKPIAAICHAPWALVEAGVLPGKTLTSYPSVRTDIKNAGGSWVDREVMHCPANGWDLITSRNPDDLDAFGATIIELLEQR